MSRNARPHRWIALVAFVVLASLVAFGIDRALAWRAESRDRAAGAAAVAAASREVTALTTLSSKHSKRDVDRLLEGATASFRDQFERQAQAFVKALEQGEVVSTGSIDSAGLVSLHDNSATVLIAATGTVRNKQTAKPQARSYRVRADLDRVEGRWLVSGLEFVA